MSSIHSYSKPDSPHETLTEKHSQEFKVLGMTCAACAGSVESILTHFKEVENAHVNLSNKSVKIDYQPTQNSQKQFQQALEKLGYELVIEGEKASLGSAQERLAQEVRSIQGKSIFALILGTSLMLVNMVFASWLVYPYEISFLLTTVILLRPGRSFFKKAYLQIRYRRLGMDTLVALSAGIAYLSSTIDLGLSYLIPSHALSFIYFESAGMIIAFVLLGKYLEERAKEQSNQAIRKLMDLQPKELAVIRNGQEVLISLAELKKSERVKVKPGDRIPVDGQVIKGTSSVDESMLSGESLPSEKNKGDKVYAGTMNQGGLLLILSQEIGEDTRLGQIVQAVREAQGSKAPIQKKVDQISQIFVPLVIGVAALTFFLWYLIAGPEYINMALKMSLSVLVIACPCALGLATPTALAVGIGRAAQAGILIRNAEQLEHFSQIQELVLDKTGTLSKGKPQVSELKWEVSKDVKYSNILYSLEKNSTHPFAEAIAQILSSESEELELESFKSIPACGVQANYQGQSYWVGKASWIYQSLGLENTEEGTGEEDPQSQVYFANEEQVLAKISLHDPLKPESLNVIRELQKEGLKISILSGDRMEVVRNTAQKLGISNYQGALLPEDKGAYIRKQQSRGMKVAMVGDGINDAEALAQADVSIAMGQGTDVALEVAGITLRDSSLNSLSYAWRLAKAIQGRIYENLFWAFIYNLICIPIAAGVLYPWNGFNLSPMLAAGAMALSSVSVVLNSVRLQWHR